MFVYILRLAGSDDTVAAIFVILDYILGVAGRWATDESHKTVPALLPPRSSCGRQMLDARNFTFNDRYCTNSPGAATDRRKDRPSTLIRTNSPCRQTQTARAHKNTKTNSPCTDKAQQPVYRQGQTVRVQTKPNSPCTDKVKQSVYRDRQSWNTDRHR